MKKIILLLAALCLLIGCGNNNPKQDKAADSEKITETTAEINDESAVDDLKSFAVETYKIQSSKTITEDGEENQENLMSFECEVDIPVTDNQALYDSICYWFAQQLGSDYNDDPRDVKALVNHYQDRALETEEDEEDDEEDDEIAEGFDLSYTMKLIEANDRYVTYCFGVFFESVGSPRADMENTYVTFNSNTGTRFTRQMILVDEDLKQLVMNELFEQFFSDWSSEQLAELLFFDPEEEEYGFFLPQYDEPWIFNNSIYFGYSVHEIADRCTGQPHCGLPYNVMEPYLTEEGKAFF